MTSVILLFLLIKEIHHETPQNVQISFSPVFHQGGVSLPQEKLQLQPDARRHPAVTDALLQTSSGVPVSIDKSQDWEAPGCLHD
jgi:hypothetical protein